MVGADARGERALPKKRRMQVRDATRSRLIGSGTLMKGHRSVSPDCMPYVRESPLERVRDGDSREGDLHRNRDTRDAEEE